jgi:hypothetical protein
VAEKAKDSLELSQMEAFVDMCSYEVLTRIRDQLRTEWESNGVRLKESLNLSRRKKSSLLARLP